ncbi:hypothetical protein UY416_11600 [Paenibacillus polymyxa]|uniref:hypothetical protein n=1 Tax=Paenibacillus polymyxa TaxID=1406 RepID=UPI002AB4756F|nr:hypothetical protein [Paenibacillus polymyxa]MDY8046943.1 hypothetical protein [Paenibacillus polymyxa]
MGLLSLSSASCCVLTRARPGNGFAYSDQSCFAGGGVEQWNQFGSTRMDLVAEAKSNTVAYERHGTPATDRGRYRKKRTKVVLG